MDEETSVAELPLEGAGARLLRAREAKKLSRADLAGLTKIPERHLVAIEQGNFAALPASTYAIGFSRSYARAVGLPEHQIADEVRIELAALQPEALRRAAPAFEPGDPARVPSARVAWIAGLLALVVAVAGLTYWRGSFGESNELPSILPSETAQVAAPIATVAPTTGGTVVFTALKPAIWVKFYDGAGTQLLQKELAEGESYTVPGNVADVRLWTARPEALAITVAGQPVAKLADEQRTMKDVPVTAAALLARRTDAAPVPTSTSGAPAQRQVQPRRVTASVRDQPVIQRPIEAAPLPSALAPPAVPAPAASATTTADR